MPDFDTYYEFGSKLTPLGLWEGSFKNPRLLQIEIIDDQRPDNIDGWRRVRITPSDKMNKYGVSIDVNDHFKLQKGQTGTKMEIVKMLDENWEQSLDRSNKIVNNLLEKLGI